MYSFAKVCRFCKNSDKHFIDITSKMFREIRQIYNILSKDTDAELNTYFRQVCQICFLILTSISDTLSECNGIDIVFRKYIAILKANVKSYSKCKCIITDKFIYYADIHQCHDTIKKDFVEDLNRPSTSNEYNEYVKHTEMIKAEVVGEYNEQSNSDVNQCKFCHKKFNSTSNVNRHKGNLTQQTFFHTGKHCFKCSLEKDVELNTYLHQVCQTCFEMLFRIFDILSECDRTDINFRNYLSILKTNGKTYAICKCIIDDKIIHYIDVNQCHGTIKKEFVENLNVPTTSNEYNENIIHTEMIKAEVIDKYSNSDLNNIEERSSTGIIDELKSIPYDDIEHIYLECASHDTLLNEDNYNCQDAAGNEDDSKQHSTKEEKKENILIAPKLNDIDKQRFTFNSQQCSIPFSQSQNEIQCNFGHKKLNSTTNLKRHVRKHTGKCDEHIHRNGRSFECDVCSKKFNEKKDLIRHTRIHTGERPFECDICNKKFNQTSSLTLHKRIHTGERPFECNFCKKRFFGKAHLTRHTRIHTGVRPFECDVCNKKFNEKRDLTNHKRIHTGERPFECDICKKTFHEKGDLTKHKRIHTGECPFKCDFCNKNFNDKGDLISHKRIHTGERPFECDICKKKFSLKGNLTKHRRIHTNERPFECDLCNKSFSQKASLIRHARIHANEIYIIKDMV